MPTYEHGYPAVLLHFNRPLDIRVDGVEACVQGMNVVVADRDKGVVRLPQPEEDDIAGIGGVLG